MENVCMIDDLEFYPFKCNPGEYVAGILVRCAQGDRYGKIPVYLFTRDFKYFKLCSAGPCNLFVLDFIGTLKDIAVQFGPILGQFYFNQDI